jgi:hypothetical membrane protein
VRLRTLGLAAATAVPILYYGTQLAALPFYPGYEPLRQPASALGSDASLQPWLFNGGAILTGLASFGAAYGVAAACLALGGWRWAAWLAALALLSCGLASLNAGWFPLPDPRHNPGWLGLGTFLLPPVLLLAVWRIGGLGWLRLFLAAAILAVAALAPFMAGWAGVDRAAYGGLLQRLLTLPLFLSVAAAGLGLRSRLRQLDPQEASP